MKNIPSGFCLLLLIAVLLAAGCGQVPVFPVGAYVANTVDQEFLLDFAADGTYTAVLAGDKLITNGGYRPAGNVITFAADPPCMDEASYEWTLDGETLTFEVSGQDHCRDRQAYLQDTVYSCVTCT